MCSHPILLKKPPKYGINSLTLKWFTTVVTQGQATKSRHKWHSLIIKYLQHFSYTRKHSWPILFQIYVNELYAVFNLFKLKFADDTVGLANINNLNTLVEQITSEIEKIARWFRANRMEVNISKTKFIDFHTKGRSIGDNIQLLYDDNEQGGHNPNLIKPI